MRFIDLYQLCKLFRYTESHRKDKCDFYRYRRALVRERAVNESSRDIRSDERLTIRLWPKGHQTV